MARNKITDLRDHLFATIEGLLDADEPLDIKRAQAVAEVATVIVESAKAEVMYMKVTGQTNSDFIPPSRQLSNSN